MILELTNITQAQARALVEYLWGSCVWGFEPDAIRCYPANDVVVTLKTELSKDTG